MAFDICSCYILAELIEIINNVAKVSKITSTEIDLRSAYSIVSLWPVVRFRGIFVVVFDDDSRSHVLELLLCNSNEKA